jgi:hypothetical protein
MGNTSASCCCGPSDEDAKKDRELDDYINKYHREPSKVCKFDKNDYLLTKQEIPIRTFKAKKNMEILDDKARAQDM